MSTTLYKLTSVLPLPTKIREKIYDDLEPYIAITPQYPINIRKATEPGWPLGYESNPLHGINNIMSEEIKSRYYNTNDTAQPPFLPKKTTFRIWHRQSPLMKMRMDAFFAKNNNTLGVIHLEYIFDGYYCSSEADDQFFATLGRFPQLQTLRIVLNYRVGAISRRDADSATSWLGWLLGMAFPVGLARMVEPYPVAEGRARSVKWNIQEFCVLEEE